MGMIAAHFTLIYVTLQTSGDSTGMGSMGTGYRLSPALHPILSLHLTPNHLLYQFHFLNRRAFVLIMGL